MLEKAHNYALRSVSQIPQRFFRNSSSLGNRRCDGLVFATPILLPGSCNMCYFFSVSTFKETRLRTQTELLGSAVVQYLDHIPKEDYKKHALEQRLKTCVTAQRPDSEKNAGQ